MCTFLIAYRPTGWMQLNKHDMVGVFKIIVGWQVWTLNSSSADLSFSSFVVVGSVKVMEPFLGFRDVKLQTSKTLLRLFVSTAAGITAYSQH